MFGSYKTSNELGRGGMAVVYLAEHQLLHNQVAIKVLNNEFVRNEHIRRRFLAEARNMARMSHPNIIKVTDLIDEGDNVAFVMEYIEGDTLKDYLERKGKLSEKEIKNIFTQMLDAVGYVHEQKLVHRDIKPSNFMITPNGKVKLMDFGIAKNTDASSAEYTQTGTGVQMGTPMYMSPEQVTETKSVTAQSDIYSLGVLLWQMVSGRKPYDMATLSAFHLQSKIVNEPLENTGTAWDSLIRKATAKEIALRYTSANEFNIALNGSVKNANAEETLIEINIKHPHIPETHAGREDVSSSTSFKVEDKKTNNLINNISMVFGGFALFQIFIGFPNYNWNLFERSIRSDAFFYLIILIILPIATILFFKRKKIGWVLLAGFLSYSVIIIIARMIIDTFYHLVGTVMEFMFFSGALLFICQNEIKKIYEIDKMKMLNTISIVTIITVAILSLLFMFETSSSFYYTICRLSFLRF
jgi:serine/threonine protein kinase